VYVASLDVASGLVIDAPAPITQTFVGANRGPDWSPDGQQIAYLSQRLTGPSTAINPLIVIRAIATGTETTLRPGLTRVGRPRWTRDGQRLVVYGLDAGGGKGMYAIDARTGAASLLFSIEGQTHAALPATHLKDGTMFVHRRTLSTGADQVIFRAPYVQNLAPSPDGTLVAFSYPSHDKDGREASLVVLPVDGGTPRRLVTVTEPDAFALDGVAWTPDGRYLLFVKRSLKGRPHSVWRIPAAGGVPQPLDLPMDGLNVGLRIHPDGRRVAFTSGEPRGEIWVLENLLGRAAISPLFGSHR
jgi:Tol biopolymer transport system component